MKGIDIVVLIIVGIILYFAYRSSIGHMKGEGACCGGKSSSIVPNKRLENSIIDTFVIEIDGMTCDHCVARIKKALNEIEGVSAIVSLHNQNAIISVDRDIDKRMIEQKIIDLGYKIKR